MQKFLIGLAVILVAPAIYLLAWPIAVQPTVWKASESVKAAGIYAPNGLLKNIQRIAGGIGQGPEGVAVDALGRVYAGYEDGRIAMISADGTSYQDIGISRHGRPLGITFGPNGGLVIADARKGLLALGATPKVRSLVKVADDRPFALTAAVDNTRFDKNVYFTDASRFPLEQRFYDAIEHRGSGRLLEYNIASQKTRILMDGLLFANGVAVGPDDAYVLVCESDAFRIHRYWLKGEKAGTHEIFIENLPGTPENISFDEKDQLFWLALGGRLPDDVAAIPPWQKKLLARLPPSFRPKSADGSWVLGIGTNGKVSYSLDDFSGAAYGPITSVTAWGPWLWFGSGAESSLARLPINQVVSGAPVPPPGWQTVPRLARLIAHKMTAEEIREQHEEQERAGLFDDDDEEDEEERNRRADERH